MNDENKIVRLTQINDKKHTKMKSRIHVEIKTGLFLKSFSLYENMAYECIWNMASLYRALIK